MFRIRPAVSSSAGKNVSMLRETGLFLIGYAALVGWLGTRQAMPKPPAGS
jgi:hypothetical protein